MNKIRFVASCMVSVWAGISLAVHGAPVVPFPFTYQGRLTDGGQAAHGDFELRFGIWSASSGGAELFAVTNAVTAVNGLITTEVLVPIDLPTTDAGAWLGIGIRPAASSGAFTNLSGASGRQRLGFAPYAMRAYMADTALRAVDSGVGNAQLQTDAVTSEKLAAGAVTTTDLATNAVTSAKIADGTIAAADLNPSTFNTTFWRVNGNQGTTEGTHYLGTSDFQPLDFRVAGVSTLRLELGNNIVGGSGINSVADGVTSSVVAGGGAVFGLPARSWPNVILGDYSFIGGGYANSIGTNYASAIVGGYANTNLAEGAFIGGGSFNRIDLSTAFSTGGGSYAVIGGGYYNTASGEAATVPGGSANEANADLSFAAGRRAKANHTGSFVWADSVSADFASTRDNQFRVRARGGVEIVGGPFVETFKFTGSRGGGFESPVAYGENTNTIGNAGPTLRLVGRGASAVDGVLSVSTLGTGYLATFGNSGAFVSRLTTNGTWTALAFNSTSDRDAKENFASVDPRAVLEKVTALPISRWNFKATPEQQHLGPVAQDFHAAFGLNGDDDRHITTVDADGVALAAIQGLNQKIEERDARIARLERQNADLLQRLESLERRVR